MQQYLWSVTTDQNGIQFYLKKEDNDKTLDAEIQFKCTDPSMSGLVVPRIRVPMNYMDPCNGVIIKASDSDCNVIHGKISQVENFVFSSIYDKIRDIAIAYVEFYKKIGMSIEIYKISIPILHDDGD